MYMLEMRYWKAELKGIGALNESRYKVKWDSLVLSGRLQEVEALKSELKK